LPCAHSASPSATAADRTDSRPAARGAGGAGRVRAKRGHVSTFNKPATLFMEAVIPGAVDAAASKRLRAMPTAA